MTITVESFVLLGAGLILLCHGNYFVIPQPQCAVVYLCLCGSLVPDPHHCLRPLAPGIADLNEIQTNLGIGKGETW